jgi:ferredoxin
LVDKEAGARGKFSPETWLKLRRISQVVFFILVLGAFLWSRRVFYLNPGAGSGIQEKLINLPLKLDPLVMIAQLIASRKVLTGFLFAILTLVITVLLGRVWCGWFCPLGSILDWIPIRSWKKNRPKIPQYWRGLKYILMSVILFAGVVGNLTLLFLDPITIFYRTLTTAVWPALDQVVTAAEVALYRVGFLQPVIGGFDSIIRPTILPSYPATYRFGLLYFSFFLLLILLNVLAPHFWCRYLCPLGGLLALVGKNSLVRCEITESCTLCGSCIDICPTGAIHTEEEVFVDPGECTMCMTCGADCPGGAVSYPARFAQVIHQPYDLDRKKAIISLGTAVLGVGILESGIIKGGDYPKMLRPPGVDTDQFLSTCIRCGECSTVCPTNAIQLAVTEAGIDGFWTPILIPRLGYCDYSCHACGIVCPVEAIPPLSLEDKRKQIIGIAEIDRTCCLPWAEDQDCIVCEEMCPISEKAIELQTVQITTAGGEEKTLQRPYVIRRLCIGCGICENKCPVSGEAAIQIKVHQRQRKGKGRGKGFWNE